MFYTVAVVFLQRLQYSRQTPIKALIIIADTSQSVEHTCFYILGNLLVWTHIFWHLLSAILCARLSVSVCSCFCASVQCLCIKHFTFLSAVMVPLQPQELTDILEISNMVFTSLFSLEMLLKLLALGLFGYIKNPYNGFDSIIVIIRWDSAALRPQIMYRMLPQACWCCQINFKNVLSML